MSANPFNDQLWAQVCQAFDDGWDYGVQEKFNHKGKRAEGLRRAIAALDAALDAAGYAVVPKEPTEKMFFQSWRSVKDDHSGFINVGVLRTLYAAMLTAAKETP